MIKHAIVTGLTALLTLSGAVQAQDNRIDTIRSDAPELAPYGKLDVGVKTLKLVNPGQQDIVKFKAGEPMPTYDRPLTVEVWYPAKLAAGQAPAGQYKVLPRDGKTEVTLNGRAVRDAQPDASTGPYPLLIISHGYPGNRFLMSHLGENLASKGYVVVSIDHTDSTYDNQTAFGSTLLNRPLDQLFVLNEMARLGANDPAGTLKGMVNADNTGLIGYSMGGYGVVNTIGGGFTAASVGFSWGTPNGALAVRQAGNPAHTASMDPRVKAAVAFAPWGWNAGFWDAAGLAGIKTPVFFVAGSVDSTSGYAPGVRNIYEGSVNAPRYLLTYENANHNAGAPMPAPKEMQSLKCGDGSWGCGEHYTDAVWDNVRMNNIAQHFVTAFLAKQLKSDATMDSYLNLVENAQDGKWSAEANGTLKSDHSYWKGFRRSTAVGLKLEQRKP
ncbi:MAG: dienelactone hydrolase, partial [Betaproteobacteria bacterium]|nr:dienelactone hydrolase [Betaproteobacteria bacterium]